MSSTVDTTEGSSYVLVSESSLYKIDIVYGLVLRTLFLFCFAPEMPSTRFYTSNVSDTIGFKVARLNLFLFLAGIPTPNIVEDVPFGDTKTTR